ncbi:hypothetical protein B0I35DRAFT_185447 [Stachybotrys elegans]|uniref:Uncharacterized protein n=1 Tax=Stachybotrys elegans TaxID=80388 RepID=A0A8K0SWZ9_9HYPO|nr:hypothetical protein B0I35DRAFT_185447 [Stachybotrys elegans]
MMQAAYHSWSRQSSIKKSKMRSFSRVSLPHGQANYIPFNMQLLVYPSSWSTSAIYVCKVHAQTKQNKNKGSPSSTAARIKIRKNNKQIPLVQHHSQVKQFPAQATPLDAMHADQSQNDDKATAAIHSSHPDTVANAHLSQVSFSFSILRLVVSARRQPSS